MSRSSPEAGIKKAVKTEKVFFECVAAMLWSQGSLQNKTRSTNERRVLNSKMESKVKKYFLFICDVLCILKKVRKAYIERGGGNEFLEAAAYANGTIIFHA